MKILMYFTFCVGMAIDRGAEELYLQEARLERQFKDCEPLLQSIGTIVTLKPNSDVEALSETSKRAVRRLCGFWDRCKGRSSFYVRRGTACFPSVSVSACVSPAYVFRFNCYSALLLRFTICPTAGWCCCTRTASCALTSLPQSHLGGNVAASSGSSWSPLTPSSCNRRARCFSIAP